MPPRMLLNLALGIVGLRLGRSAILVRLSLAKPVTCLC